MPSDSSNSSCPSKPGLTAELRSAIGSGASAQQLQQKISHHPGGRAGIIARLCVKEGPARVSGRHVVRRTDSPHLSWKCAQVTGKAGENGQYPCEMCSSPWKRPSVPGCGDTARSGVAIQVSLALASGSLSTGSPAGGALTKKGDGSMYSQAYVSRSVLRLPSASVAVRDRGHWIGVCGKRVGP